MLINLKEQSGFVKKVQSRKMGLSSGFSGLDSRLYGLNPHYYLVAARPSMGKSALLMNMAANMGKNGTKILFFSIEMPEVFFLERMISMISGIPVNNVRSDDLSEEGKLDLDFADKTLKSFDMYVDYSPSQSPISIKKIIDSLATEKQWIPDVVFIDYIQYMRTDDNQHLNNAGDLTNVSRSLASMVKQYNIPFVVAAQVRREPDEKRKAGKAPAWPKLSDLKGSGCLEEDTDIVLFIHRDDYYSEREDKNHDPDAEELLNTDFIIAKNRYGYPCHYKLSFLKDITKFAEVDLKEKEDGETIT